MTKKKVVVKKRKVKKSLTFSQVLNVIDDVLVKEDGTSRVVWDVLTALRGPDSGSYIEKANHTIPIRRAAFPKMAKLVDKGTKDGPADFMKNNYLSPVDSFTHFARHIYNAANALNLVEDSNNE